MKSVFYKQDWPGGTAKGTTQAETLEQALNLLRAGQEAMHNEPELSPEEIVALELGDCELRRTICDISDRHGAAEGLVLSRITSRDEDGQPEAWSSIRPVGLQLCERCATLSGAELNAAEALAEWFQTGKQTRKNHGSGTSSYYVYEEDEAE